MAPLPLLPLPLSLSKPPTSASALTSGLLSPRHEAREPAGHKGLRQDRRLWPGEGDPLPPALHRIRVHPLVPGARGPAQVLCQLIPFLGGWLCHLPACCCCCCCCFMPLPPACCCCLSPAAAAAAARVHPSPDLRPCSSLPLQEPLLQRTYRHVCVRGNHGRALHTPAPLSRQGEQGPHLPSYIPMPCPGRL